LKIFSNLFKNISSGNTLYYPGCLTRFVAKDIQDNYRQILSIVGIDTIELEGIENCCGSPLKNAGEFESFAKLAEKNLDVFKQYGVSDILTSCPACFTVLKEDYSEILGTKWNLSVKYILEPIYDFLQDNKNSAKANMDIDYTYHDPCHLGRYSGFFELPREILNLCCGNGLREMRHSREESLCCGGGAGLNTNFEQISRKILDIRTSESQGANVQYLYTTCPMCALRFSESDSSEKQYGYYGDIDISGIILHSFLS
jgi:Fe-S oxidoreductase